MSRLRRPRAGRPVKTFVTTVSSDASPGQGEPVHRGGERLGTEQVRRTDLYRGGAEHEAGRDAATVSDPAGRDHRQVHRVDHPRHEGDRARLRSDVLGEKHSTVPAGFGTLSDHHVAPVCLEPYGFGHGRRRRHHDRTGGADALDELGIGQAEVEADHFGAATFDQSTGVLVERVPWRGSHGGAVDAELTVESGEGIAPLLEHAA